MTPDACTADSFGHHQRISPDGGQHRLVFGDQIVLAEKHQTVTGVPRARVTLEPFVIVIYATLDQSMRKHADLGHVLFLARGQ